MKAGKKRLHPDIVAATPRLESPRTRCIIVLLLVILAVAAFWQVPGHDFINFDDDVYVTDNRHVKHGLTIRGVAWAFTSGHGNNWHPLTWVSHMVDVSLYGLKPAGHHATNLVLHILNTLLLFLVLLRLAGHNPQSPVRNPKSEIQNPVAPSPTPPLSPSSVWKCAFVAALFAIHPLHVESVAWVAERKDVLSTLFFLLTTLVYVRYVQKPGPARYLSVVGLFMLGLMAKPMLVTLPFALLLLDYWPLGRLDQQPAASSRPSATRPDRPVAVMRTGGGARGSVRSPETRIPKPVTRTNTQHLTPNVRLLLEKLPLLVLAAGSCIVTVIVQGGAISPLDKWPLGVRIANALVAYVAYILKMLWPAELSVFYPLPIHGWPVWEVVGSATLLLAISIAVMRLRRTKPYLAAGWLWYLITLVPVIGFVQVGAQSMADRYTYVPLIGLFVMIAWGIPDLMKGRKGERGKGGATRRHGDTETRGGTEAQTSNVEPTFAKVTAGKHRIPDTEHRTPNTVTSGRPLISSPPHPLMSVAAIVVVILTALTWRQVGYWKNSITLFDHAVKVTTDNYLAHNNLGSALEKAGDDEGAAAEYNAVLEIVPNHALAHNNLASVLMRQGKIDEAIAEFETARSLKPDDPAINNNLGVALAKRGDKGQALRRYADAAKASPDDPSAHFNLGSALLRQRKYAEAADELSKGLELEPSSSAAHSNLGVALLSMGKAPEAIKHFTEAIRLDPKNSDAESNLGVALFQQRNVDEAMRHYARAIELEPEDPQNHLYMAVALYLKGMYSDAWMQVRECRRYGGDPGAKFLSALSAKMPEPAE